MKFTLANGNVIVSAALIAHLNNVTSTISTTSILVLIVFTLSLVLNFRDDVDLESRFRIDLSFFVRILT